MTGWQDSDALERFRRALEEDPDLLTVMELEGGRREYDPTISDEVMVRSLHGHKHAAHWAAPPGYIIEFIARYVERTAGTIAAVTEVPSGPLGFAPLLAERLQPSQAYGVCCSAVEHRAASLRYPECPFIWDFFDGKWFAPTQHANVAPVHLADVFVSAGVVESEDEEFRMILEETQAATSFLFVADDRGPSLAEFLWTAFGGSGIDIQVEALLTIPAATFARYVDTPVSLLVVHPDRKQNDVFVGVLTDDHSRVDVLLDNLVTRRSGVSPELGAFVAPDALRPVSELVADQRLEQRLSALAIPLCRLSDIGRVIDSAATDGRARVSDESNSVYLPLQPGLDATTQVSGEDHERAFVRVILDPHKALADYVAYFFNSDLGRESLSRRLYTDFSSGSTAHRNLGEAMVSLPNLESQRQFITTQTAIRDVRTELRTAERQLWGQPHQGEVIAKKIGHLVRGERREDWMETLPFPLASILWQYLRESALDKQVDHLLHFFEAAAEFQAILLLSGCRQMPGFEKGLGETNAADTSQPPFADFGTWTAVSQNLGRRVRQALNTTEGRSLILPAFGSPPLAFLRALADEDLVAVIRKAGRRRNQWKHGGVYDDMEARARLGIMEVLLSQFHAIVLDRFSEVSLLLPIRSEWDGTEYDHEVQVLMGTRTPFRQEVLRTPGPLSTKSLYVGFTQGSQPVELVPLLLLGPEPSIEKEAVYFYSRIEKGRVHWVSYHYRPRGRMETPVGTVPGLMPTLELIGRLKASGRP